VNLVPRRAPRRRAGEQQPSAAHRPLPGLL